MTTEFKTISGEQISQLGIGTYGIGGTGHRHDEITDETPAKTYIDAIVYQLSKSLNFTEITIAYGHGRAAEFFAKAIQESGLSREDVFITNSLYPRDYQSAADIEKDIDDMYKVFRTDIFDSTLVTLSLLVKFGYSEILEILQKLLKDNRTRYVSLSNSNLATIKKFKKEFGDLFFAHEGHISFEIRANQDKGIFDLCQNLGVENIIWRPLRQNRTAQHNWSLLVELSEKYSKTQNQIILNWLTKGMGFRPMVMSKNPEHIGENVEALDFRMDSGDYVRLRDFRVKGYTQPNIDWDKTGDGISISKLPDGFEDNYEPRS